jgi:aminoglycoside phosphotransferase
MHHVAEHIGTDWHLTLADVVAAHVGLSRRIAEIERRPSEYRSSSLVDDVTVIFEDRTSIDLVVKSTHREAMCPEARRAKPPLVCDDERERTAYERILSTADVGMRSYIGSYRSAGVRYLVFERIHGVPLWQCGDVEAWHEAARWLARMHFRVDVVRAMSPRAVHLLRYDRPFHQWWMLRASAFHRGDRKGLVALRRFHPRVMTWLEHQDLSFVHGEYYPSNLLVERDRHRDAFVIHPVDWEMAGIGPALIDLACLTSGRWTDDQRATFGDAYYAERGALGGDVPPRERYLKTLDYCLIQLSVRNLGWSRDWTPPADRAYDWLGEALRLCEKWDV